MVNPTRLLGLTPVLLTVFLSVTISSPPSYSLEASQEYALFSSLAYCPKACIESWTCLDSKGIEVINLSYVNSGIDLSSCFIAYRPTSNEVVVSFRGAASYEQWIKEFDHQVTNYPNCEDCAVVNDFLKSYVSMEKEINSGVVSLLAKYPKAGVTTTGHSLGGALAILSALRLKQNLPSRKVSVHNFGALRVGTRGMARYLAERIDSIVRVVHDRDMVTHQPLDWQGYVHPPYEVFFNDKMDSYQVCDQSGEDSSCTDQYPPDSLQVEDNYFYFRRIAEPRC